MTAYAAGLCASELGRLQLTDVDSARMCLRVNQGKGDKDRYVPLSPRLLELLREYWRNRRPSALAVPHTTPRPPEEPSDACTHLPRRQGQGPYPQARRDSYVEALFLDPSNSGFGTKSRRRAGSLVHRFRNNHRLFRNASMSSSGRYRTGRICDGSVLAIACSFSFRSACRYGAQPAR